jgi:hypothetical protein
MADQENQNIEALEAENNEESMAYWCYQCDKEVSLEPHEEESQTRKFARKLDVLNMKS